VLGQNFFLIRLIGASGKSFAWQLLRAIVPVMSVMWGVSVWCDGWLVVESWMGLGLKAVLLLVPVLPIGYFIVLDKSERQMVKDRIPFLK
jgi:hypothetical protein